MKNKTLIVVANGERALFIELEKNHFEIIEEREHPQSKEKVSQLVSDRSGENSGSGSFFHYPLNEGREILKAEREKFAREVVKFCEDRHRKGSFQKLWIVSGPQFLGQLRPHLQSLSPLQLSIQEIHKEIAPHESLDEMMGKIHEWVHGNAPRKGALWKRAS